MKSVWIYHLVADLPVLLFFIYYFESGRPLSALIAFGIIYPFVYRPIVDYYRLTALGKIKEGDYKKITRHGTLSYRFKYYSSLMFKNR